MFDHFTLSGNRFCLHSALTPKSGVQNMFHDRAGAAKELAEVVRHRHLKNPLVLGIPRGGAVTAAVLAEEIGAEMDVVLARKLRAPDAPELAIGAICETGEVYFNHAVHQAPGLSDEYVHQECQIQLQEIERRKKMFRAVRPAAPIAGRSVIVTDDGIATGATMISALQATRVHKPLSLIAAVPVASPDRIREVRHWCDDVVCLLTPRFFYAVGQFYEDFEPVSDEQVMELLHRAMHSPAAMVE
jgi:putative phosphoribosyl transferase